LTGEKKPTPNEPLADVVQQCGDGDSLRLVSVAEIAISQEMPEESVNVRPSIFFDIASAAMLRIAGAPAMRCIAARTFARPRERGVAPVRYTGPGFRSANSR
jgi:hypothetical protein